MTWLPLLVLLGSLLACVCSNPLLQQRELAPSLVLERINNLSALRDSIDKLQQMNTKVRCHIRGYSSPDSRPKRYVGPSQHLDEMISALQLGDLPMGDDC